MERFDLLALGAGPGGYMATLLASKAGFKCALVSSPQDLGGVCLNRGCIPTKALLHVAEQLRGASKLAEAGLKIDLAAMDFPALMQKGLQASQAAGKGLAYTLREAGVVVFEGWGQAVAPDRVLVGEQELACGRLVIATGSQPLWPSIPGLGQGHPRLLTSDELFHLQERPRRVALLGAGYQGTEFAFFFAALGSEVSLIETLPAPFPREEPEAVQVLLRAFKEQGISGYFETRLASISETATGLELALEGPKGLVQLETDLLGVAIGRKANTEGLEALGLQLDARGFIAVDLEGNTNVAGVFAVGDVAGPPLLAHKAFQDAERLVAGLTGAKSPQAEPVIPSCVFSFPELARVGLTEAEAKATGKPVLTELVPLKSLGRAAAMGERSGLIKLVAEGQTGRLLGITLLCPMASELLGEATLAVAHKMTAGQLAATSHMHPTFSEGLKEGAAALASKLETAGRNQDETI